MDIRLLHNFVQRGHLEEGMDTADDNSETNTSNAMFQMVEEKGVFVIPFEFFVQYSFIGNTILTPVICVLGMCGNSLGIYLLCKECRHQRLSVYRYMLALMIFDNMYLFLGLVTSVMTIIQTFDFYLANKLLTFFSFGSGYLDVVIYHTSSVLLTVMAIERLNALVRPFTVRRSWLSKYPNQLIAVILVISACYILPYPICFQLDTTSSFDNRTTYSLQINPHLTTFYQHYSLSETIISCLYPIIMLVINIAIPIAYRRVVKQRRMDLPNLSSRDNQQLKVTLMIVWICIMYILLALPKIFLQTLILIDGDYDFDGKHSLTFYFFLFTGDIFARLNAANDFFIYVLVSRRYRRMLKVMLCRRCINSEPFNGYSDIFRSTSQVFLRANSSYVIPRTDNESVRSTQISFIDGR